MEKQPRATLKGRKYGVYYWGPKKDESGGTYEGWTFLNAGQLAHKALRHQVGDTAEHDLLLAIITQSIGDYFTVPSKGGEDLSNIQSARWFLGSVRLSELCEVMGLDQTYVYQVMADLEAVFEPTQKH